jgi:GTP 3',8-cyclase
VNEFVRIDSARAAEPRESRRPATQRLVMSWGDGVPAAAPALGSAGPEASDQFGRKVSKLRISLTDRCNYRCIYCMPECPVWKPPAELLSLEELRDLAGLFVRRIGIRQIRLTGGEPLLRRGVARLVAMLAELRSAGLERVSLSTNGVLLHRCAGELAAAGLDDLNVSLDSLAPDQFAYLTGGAKVGEVLRGIDAARGAGLPVKLNAVIIRGCNEDAVLPLAKWAYREALPLRFIEFMPLDGRGLWSRDKVVTESEIIAQLGSEFELERLPRTHAPAVYYLLNGRLEIGVISTVSNPFCAQCDRMRLTADGRLFTCLFASAGADLRQPLRTRRNLNRIESIIRRTLWAKPPGFVEKLGLSTGHANMHVLGG